MFFEIAQKKDLAYLCCEGRVKSYEEYQEFVEGLDTLIRTHLESQNPTPWRITLLDAFPFNTYALGHILRLKIYDNYDFSLATNNYRTLELLELVEFHEMFELSVEHDPRIYKSAKDLLKDANQSPQNTQTP